VCLFAPLRQSIARQVMAHGGGVCGMYEQAPQALPKHRQKGLSHGSGAPEDWRGCRRKRRCPIATLPTDYPKLGCPTPCAIARICVAFTNDRASRMGASAPYV